MKKGLLVVVALLALASLMAVMAYTDGYVHNTGYLKVSASDEALLAVIPADTSKAGYKDITAQINGFNKVQFNFGQGIGGKFFGLQPSSRYSWDRLITVQNNSEDDLELQFGVHEPLANYLTITNKTTNKVVYKKGETPWFGISSNEGIDFRFDIEIPQGAPLVGTIENNIVINTRAVDSGVY